MTKLEEKIMDAQDAYYNEQPIMSDEEFDALWDKLKKENPNSIIFRKVGEDSSSNFEKAKHVINMNSQEKVNNEKDFESWWKKRIKTSAIVQYKLDGISIELQYKNGVLDKAITRGDGNIGDDITSNVKKMNGFPIEVNSKINFAVRGEIILPKSTFEKKYRPKGYANPRNMASGLSKQKSGQGCEDLKIIFYDMFAEKHEENIGKKEIDKIKFLESEGFSVVEYREVNNSLEVSDIRNELSQEKRESLEYDIDGLVVKNNIYNPEDAKRVRPQFQIAFKFDTVTAVTKIENVYWSVSGRIITPVALLEPVVLEGAIVRRASLANPNRLRELRLHYGDLVLVSRRGQIIPYIEKVVQTNEKGERIPPALEKYVDNKGVDWPVTDEGTRLVISEESFPQIRYHRIKKWIDKLGVKGFGVALLNKLFTEGWVNEIADLYMIDLDRYLRSTNLKKAAQKAFDNLYSVKKVSLAKFVSGFDIEDVGEKIVALTVKNGYDTLKKLEEASVTKLSNIDGIGDHRAKQIVNGVYSLKSEMFKVLNFVSIENEEVRKVEGVEGKSFCFTGALESMKRKEAQELVESMGGVSKSSVSKDLDYLVNNDVYSNSSKNKKANEYGVKIIDENTFLSMVGK